MTWFLSESDVCGAGPGAIIDLEKLIVLNIGIQTPFFYFGRKCNLKVQTMNPASEVGKQGAEYYQIPYNGSTTWYKLSSSKYIL